MQKSLAEIEEAILNSSMKAVNKHSSVSLKISTLYFKMYNIKQRSTGFLEDIFEAN